MILIDIETVKGLSSRVTSRHKKVQSFEFPNMLSVLLVLICSVFATRAAPMGSEWVCAVDTQVPEDFECWMECQDCPAPSQSNSEPPTCTSNAGTYSAAVYATMCPAIGNPGYPAVPAPANPDPSPKVFPNMTYPAPSTGPVLSKAANSYASCHLCHLLLLLFML